MDIQDALTAFDALSQETRLRALRLLVRHGEEGLAAGALSAELSIPHNTLSFHLSQMNEAGLILSRKEGRSVIYTADFSHIQNLIRFLVEDCCTLDVAKMKDDKTDGCTVIKLSELTQCC